MKIKRATFELWKKRLIISFWFLIIFSIPYTYFFTSVCVVTSYTFEGVNDIYIPQITEQVQKKILKKSFKIIPRNQILSYSRSDIRNVVLEVLPNSNSVLITPAGLHTLRIHVTYHEPLFKIDESRAITKEGVIYNEINDITSLPTIILATSTVIEIKNNNIPFKYAFGLQEEMLNKIATLHTKVTSVMFTVSKIEIDTYGDIRLYDDKGVRNIIFSNMSDVDIVWSNIVSAIDTEPLKTKLQKSGDMLEYLDARFGNKIFYKFTNDSKTPSLNNHATTTATTTVSE